MLTPLPKEPKLYGIIDLSYLEPSDLAPATEQLIRGGVDILQLRAKGYDPAQILVWAEQLLPICRESKIPLVINDHPEVAKACQADGLHIGQDDGSLLTARKLVGPDVFIGRSTHSLEQAEMAFEEGFDYIGFGPIFPTPTKKGRPGIGLEDIAEVEDTVGQSIPIFCIGGIKRDNLETVIAAGASRAVIVSDLLTADNREVATRTAKNLL